MPFGHMHREGGIILLVIAVMIAIIAGVSWGRPNRPSAILTILAAIFGIIIALFILRRL
ncbi:MAG: hypothetical protein ACLPWS_16970 [Rhodomicrobium sp.]